MYLTVTDASGRRTVAIETTPFTIGRSSDNHLQLSDAEVSRRHAEILHDAGGWQVRDAGSRFGTFVNGERITERPLEGGDRIRLGQTELTFEAADSSSLSATAFDFRQVAALLAGLRALGSTRVVEEVLALVLDSALELTGAERGFILLAEDNAPLALKLARARGGITLATAKTSQRIPDEVFATGEDRIVTDLLDDAHASLHAGTVALGIRHVVCTPLNVVQYGADAVQRRIGVLYLDSRERGYLQTVGVLHALAAEASVVIENARLYKEVVERERAAQELRIAAEIQQALLPPPAFSGPAGELAAVSTPCRAVGGDLFDYVARPDGALVCAVCDVAGKGTSAALLTAVVQGLLAAEAESSDGSATVMSRVNRALCRRSIGSKFVTGFHAVRAPQGPLEYCNAGHNAPFLVTAAGVQRLDVGGPVMGLFETAAFDTGRADVAPGDVLVIFSDGVTEAENAEGEEFGDDRLEACLASARTQPAADVLDAVQRAVREFSGTAPARDDVTVMAVRFA